MMVSDTRYQLSLFSMIDYEGVEKRLEKMAAKGWEIEKAGKFLWEYRRTIPKAKKYAVVFSQDSSDYSPYPTESQQFLKEMCEQNGWKKEEYGILCPVFDGKKRSFEEKLTQEEECLADAIIMLEKDKKLRTSMHEMTLKRAWEMDMEKVLKKWMEIL